MNTDKQAPTVARERPILLSNRTKSASTRGWILITLATVAVIAVIAVLLLGGMTAQAQNGAVPNLRLSSASHGQLTIAWDAPEPTPSDYRIIWAKQGLDFLSYSATNEANRGNEYPGGDKTSITLTGLTGGDTFKVRARTRYTSGGDNDGTWSGPWTATATARVKDNPPLPGDPLSDDDKIFTKIDAAEHHSCGITQANNLRC